MNSFYNAQVRYDYMEPSYYNEIDYDMSEYSLEELNDFIADEDTREEFRTACKTTVKNWNYCEYCGNPLAHADDTGICQDCENYTEEE